MPTHILIVFATDPHATEKMARAAAEEAASVPDTIVAAKTAEEVTAADGVLIGSPVHMGSMDWRVKRIIDTVYSRLWLESKPVGKVAGVFVSGGALAGRARARS